MYTLVILAAALYGCGIVWAATAIRKDLGWKRTVILVVLWPLLASERS